MAVAQILERMEANRPGFVPPSFLEPQSPVRTPRDIYVKELHPVTSEINIRSEVVSTAGYQSITSEDEWNSLVTLAASFKGKSISWVNATMDGGGVALMRAPQVHLLQALGVDAHWYVATPDESAFQVTKKMHNTLQGVAHHEFSPEELGVYNQWTEQNAQVLRPSLRKSHVVVIDDPQPSGLIPYLRADNPAGLIIYRNHIQTQGRLMSTPATPQEKIWSFLRDHNGVGNADSFVFHPVEEFVPDDVPAEKIIFMPPSTDPLDGLNRPLTAEEYREEFDNLNRALSENRNQRPLDLTRPYMVQVARFDPAKGIPDVLESYRLLRLKMKAHGFSDEQTPQLVITGNGATDDPDGIPVLNQALDIRGSEAYRDIADDIKIARFPPHNDKLFNTILRGSLFALQLSTREGFEFKVTEASMMGKPVIASRAGGIPLQVTDGESGFLVEPSDTEQTAEYMLKLVTEPLTYQRLRNGALKRAVNENHAFTTVPNVINWLLLIDRLTHNSNFGQLSQAA